MQSVRIISLSSSSSQPAKEYPTHSPSPSNFALCATGSVGLACVSAPKLLSPHNPPIIDLLQFLNEPRHPLFLSFFPQPSQRLSRRRPRGRLFDLRFRLPPIPRRLRPSRR